MKRKTLLLWLLVCIAALFVFGCAPGPGTVSISDSQNSNEPYNALPGSGLSQLTSGSLPNGSYVYNGDFMQCIVVVDTAGVDAECVKK